MTVPVDIPIQRDRRVSPSNLLEKLFREMYTRRTDLPHIEARIVSEVDAGRFRKITNSTLEGVAKRELNLASSVGKSAEARESPASDSIHALRWPNWTCSKLARRL